MIRLISSCLSDRHICLCYRFILYDARPLKHFSQTASHSLCSKLFLIKTYTKNSYVTMYFPIAKWKLNQIIWLGLIKVLFKFFHLFKNRTADYPVCNCFECFVGTKNKKKLILDKQKMEVEHVYCKMTV